MARNNPARDRSLADIAAAQRRAGKKVSRLKGRGVDVGSIDPRRSPAEVQSMTASQRRTYLNQLARFTSRSTSYVPGYKGTPLNGALWRQYERAQRQYNAKSESFYESVKDLTIPSINQTVGQYLANLRNGENNYIARRDGDYRSFGRLERTSEGITGDAALRQLLNSMQKRADPKYLEREARLQRRIVRKMLERTGNNDLMGAVRDMSDEELITLTQYTDFMDRLKGSYSLSKSTSTDKPRWQSSVFEDNEDAIDALTEWAHKHFSDKDDSEQDTDDSRPATPTRDRFGRFAKKRGANPDPTFVRDERGRFTTRKK